MNKTINIELTNNYSLAISNEEISSIYITIDILKINILKKKINKNILLKIDFNNIDYTEYKTVLKRLLKKKKYISGVKGEDNNILLGYVLNYDNNNQKHKEFISCITAIFHSSIYEMYAYIYDTACNYLDQQFRYNNLCDFKNNRCIEKRNTLSPSLIGCCHHFKYKFMAPFIPNNKLIDCEYLENTFCCANCISCKLFTCDTLRKNGIKFKIKNILILNTFLNPLQKYIIKISVFTPKEKILKRLLFFKY